MDLCNSTDIFQEKMNETSNGLDYVRTHIDNLLIISSKPLEDHFKNLDKVLSKLKLADFKVNAEKFFFRRKELKYLVPYAEIGARLQQ